MVKCFSMKNRIPSEKRGKNPEHFLLRRFSRRVILFMINSWKKKIQEALYL